MATDLIPSSLHARKTRIAISPLNEIQELLFLKSEIQFNHLEITCWPQEPTE